MNLFTELKGKKLRRNERSEYTLGDQLLDHTIGINDSLVLTPDEEQIALFAASNFLFGIFGINVTAFTAIPSGFIASYSKDGTNFGTFIDYEPVITYTLLQLCEEYKKRQPDKASFYEELGVILSDSSSLIKKAIIAKDCINRHQIEQIPENIGMAREIFRRVNDNNCDENSKVIIGIMTDYDPRLTEDIFAVDSVASAQKVRPDEYDIIAQVMIERRVRKRNIEDERERASYKETLTEETKRFHSILHLNILPLYHVYIGKDKDKNPIEQDSQILNKSDLIERLIQLLNINQDDIKERLKGLKDISKILNICSTDYSADMVLATFDKINEITDSVTKENVQEFVDNIISSTIPRTPDNKEQKSEARNDINNAFVFGK